MKRMLPAGLSLLFVFASLLFTSPPASGSVPITTLEGRPLRSLFEGMASADEKTADEAVAFNWDCDACTICFRELVPPVAGGGNVQCSDNCGGHTNDYNIVSDMSSGVHRCWGSSCWCTSALEDCYCELIN